MSSKLSLAQRLALEKQDAHFLTQPLPMGTDPRVMAAHLRHTVRLLANREIPSPCSRAIAYLNELFERSVPDAQRERLACRAGCAHCCHQIVQVHPAEAFFIAAQLRDRPETVVAIRAVERQLNEANVKGKFWLRCPMLIGSMCSIYDARPLNCHAFTSLNVDDCIDYLTPLGALNISAISAPKAYSSLRNIVKIMGLAAMRLTGLPETAYEMNSAVGAILAQDNAEKRWLAGEDIFTNAKSYPISPVAQMEIARMVTYIAPTL
jgi:Fe-S-cluster containining protein